MGGTYMSGTYPGATEAEALAALRDHWREAGYTDVEASNWPDDGPVPWPDPFAKDVVRVWGKPVKPFAVEWMRGWAEQHPPPGVDPDDKWGPWLAFPLAERGRWHLFGWVNT